MDQALQNAAIANARLEKSLQRELGSDGRDHAAHTNYSSDSKNGSSVLDEVTRFCRQFIAYPSNDAALAHTLWIAHSWLSDLMFTTPRLAFVSPEKRSGKTRAQEVTALLVPNPVNVISVSPAYLFRKIQEKPDGHLPTIEMDETDALFTGKPSESTEQIRGIINAGYRQGATVGRAEATKNGEVKTIDFPVFAPVCLAGIGDLPDTIEDRAIIVHMKRRRPDWKLKAYRDRTVRAEAEPIRRKLSEWSESVRTALASYRDCDYPAMPDAIQDRDADVWEPLFIVAQLAGGHWPGTVTDISIRIIKAQQEEPQSIGERLLRDIRTIFADQPAIYRNTLIEGLRSIDGAPWHTLGKAGEGIDSWYLTKTLKKYDIAQQYEGKAHSIRIAGMPRDWGYYRSDFIDAWSRYLPDIPSENQVTDVTDGTIGNPNSSNVAITHVTNVTHFSKGVFNE